jgi:hypothetical protein
MDVQDVFWDGEFKKLKGTQNNKLASVGSKAKQKKIQAKKECKYITIITFTTVGRVAQSV